MSNRTVANKQESSGVPRSSSRSRHLSSVPRSFLGEVAIVAVAVVALTINMKLTSWLARGPRHQ